MSETEYEAYSGSRIENLINRRTPGLSTEAVIEKFFVIGDLITGGALYPYQRPFVHRIFEAVLEREAEEITALWSRQSGKSQALGYAASTLLVMMPMMSNEFPDDDRFNFYDVKSGTYRSYSSGFWIGIYAPKREQATIIFNRVRAFLRRQKTAELLAEMGITYDTNNGDTFRLSSGSFAKCSTASDQANIEGSTLHLAILEESQDISDEKANKSIGPMLAACVVGSTEIVATNGARYCIKDVVEQRLRLKVPCVDHSTSRMTAGVVADWVDSGVQPCRTVTLQSGRSITGTLDHPLLCRLRQGQRKLEWKTLSAIEVGAHVCLPDTTPHGTASVDSDLAYWYGAMVGNGCASYDHSPRFSHEDKGVLADMSRITRNLGCRVSSSKRPDYKSNTYRELTFCGQKPKSNPAIDLLRSVDLYAATGACKSLAAFKAYDATSCAELIAGLFDTDGHVLVSKRGGAVCFSQANEKLCLDLLDLLHRFGIHGTVRRKVSNERTLRGRRIAAGAHYLLVIAGKEYVERFSQLIRLRHSGKRAKLIKAVAAFKGHRAKVSRQYPGIVWDKVISVADAGNQQVYDLTVPQHHSFIANGIISHNTGGSLVKIGTANAVKSHFYNAIRRNERRHTQGAAQSHYTVEWEEAAKYNTFYHKFVMKEALRLGETSDEFLMNFCCRFLLERGLAVPEKIFWNRTVIEGPFADILPSPRRNMHYVAGVDFGKIHDSTVVTILEVNWDNPRQVVDGYDPEKGGFTVEIYGKHVVDWLELQGDDYEAQYVEIRRFLSRWPIARMALDYTGVGVSLGDRFKAMFDNVDVEFITYSDDSKDQLCRQFLADLHNGMITWPGGHECSERKEFKNFKTQMLDLEKEYRNGLLNLHHPDIRGCHDDYPQSLFMAIHAAMTKPYGGSVEESDGLYGKRR